MFGKSLKQQSQNLSGLALEAFILDVTSEGENYCFYELLEHPNIKTIKGKFIEIIKLFSKGNICDYQEFLKEYEELTQQQLLCLKKLTILSEFEGLRTMPISTLQKKLNADLNEIVEILLKMSIEGIVSIKIDEQTGIISIFHSERRMRPIESSQERTSSILLQQIVRKNQTIIKEIQKIKRKMGHQVVQEKKKGPNIFIF